MTGRPRAASSALILTGLLLLALNLRPAAVSVGPVLDEVRAGLGLTDVTAGLLTSLPVLAFAGFGAVAPSTARRFGLHRVVLVALLLVGAGLVVRSVVPQQSAFLVLSMLTLGGMAMSNVLMPSLVKLHFPDRIGPVTSLYTTMLAVGLSGAFALTVPLSEAGGSWRVGLGAWAVPAFVAALVWLLLQGAGRGSPPDAQTARARAAAPRVGFTDVARTRLGWAMAVFFGLQSMLAYAIFGWFASLWRDAGFAPSTAGLLVGVVAAASVPMSFVLPRLVASSPRPVWILAAVCACYPVGFVGLMLAPAPLAVLWAAVIGVGTATFPIVLVLLGLRARTPAGTAALSSFTQAVGYLLSAIGPFGVGLLHGLTNGWTVPLVVMSVVVVPLFVIGAYAIRSGPVEDQLRAPRAA